MRPSVLAVFLLALIRSLESFEVPLLIGSPGNLHTLTTAIYDSIRSGFVPKYGEASAFAVLLLALVAAPLAYYYRVTKEVDRYATITGKGFRPRRLKLGIWRRPLGLWLLIIPLALAAPVLIMLWASFLPVYKPPELADVATFSLANYRSVWGRSDTLAGFRNSALIGFWSATLVVGLTFIAAWLVVRNRGAARWALDFLISVPLVFPGIVLGITLLIQFLWLPMIPDLRHHLDSGVRLPDPFHALWDALLPRWHPGGSPRARGMRPHLRRHHVHRAAPDRAAAGAAVGRGRVALCVPPHHSRSVARDPAGRSWQPRWWPSSFSICGTMARYPSWQRWRCCWPQA